VIPVAALAAVLALMILEPVHAESPLATSKRQPLMSARATASLALPDGKVMLTNGGGAPFGKQVN
jgi:hypothetical protein